MDIWLFEHQRSSDYTFKCSLFFFSILTIYVTTERARQLNNTHKPLTEANKHHMKGWRQKEKNPEFASLS